MKQMYGSFSKGFTLAELLIALGLLGVIATFTIPKIMNAQQSAQNLGKTKEAAAILSSALQQASFNQTLTANTLPSDLIQYMNYVKLDTSSVIDAPVGGTSATCTAAQPCVKLHNGGMIMMGTVAFGGTTSSNVIEFIFDPDPTTNTTSTADGPLKAVQFDIYYDGFLTTRGRIKANSQTASYPLGACPSCDPSWLVW